MTTISSAGTIPGGRGGILDKERTIATAGFNRWLVPPAALCIHLCIGMAYGFSVFWLPLSRALGLTAPKACPDMSLVQELFTTTCDWRVAAWAGCIRCSSCCSASRPRSGADGWSASDRARPASSRPCAGAAVSFSERSASTFTSFGCLWLGSGVIGGVGLGLGYISPVSTLVKWFPDRRGMATGMAIMGFGGGAMIGAPLANLLMNYFKTPTSVGAWETFLAMGAIYLVFMMIGAFRYRIPPAGWRPEGWTPPEKANAMISQYNVHLNDAHKTPQFWMIWIVLCMNVSAGIGVIGMASRCCRRFSRVN